MSSNVSVASSITESQATTYVPGIGRLGTPAAVVVPSNERHPVRRISSLREDYDDYNINSDDGLAKEYHVDAEFDLAKSKLASWLASLHLEQYFQLLVNEGYDSMDRIRYIDRNELEHMDILPGHRRALFHAINELRKRRSSTATGGSASHHNLHMPQISEEGSHVSTIVSSRAGSATRSATSSSKDASSGRISDPTQVGTRPQTPPPESRRSSLPETSTDSVARHVHKGHRRRSIATSKDSILDEKKRIQHRLSTLKSKRDGATCHENLQPTATITKQVKFFTAEVRTYQRYWSDNPSVSAGPPIGIGWKVLAIHRFSAVTHSSARDKRNLRTGYCPVLTREEREACLEEAGFSSKDIASATREATRTKARRRTTVQNLNAGKTAEVEEAVESVRRAIVKAFVPKSKSKKQLYNTAA